MKDIKETIKWKWENSIFKTNNNEYEFNSMYLMTQVYEAYQSHYLGDVGLSQ